MENNSTANNTSNLTKPTSEASPVNPQVQVEEEVRLNISIFKFFFNPMRLGLTINPFWASYLLIIDQNKEKYLYHPYQKIRLCMHVWMEYYDCKVFTRVLWLFTTKFATLMRVFQCATCKQGQYTWKRVETFWFRFTSIRKKYLINKGIMAFSNA